MSSEESRERMLKMARFWESRGPNQEQAIGYGRVVINGCAGENSMLDGEKPRKTGIWQIS
jgi:hypothetical protein